MNNNNHQSINITLEKIYRGRVKWFNKRLGYGFIEFKDDNAKDSNIFAHYTEIIPLVTTYKTLFQGEYVCFQIEASARPDMEYQASKITGIDKGPLMADTHEARNTKNKFEKPGPSHLNDN